MTNQPKHRPLRYRLRACTSLLVLAGCAEVSTKNANVGEKSAGKASTGVHYLLPRGIIDIEGNNDQDKGFVVSLARHNEGDPGRRYLLVQHSSPFHEDTVTFTVNEKGLLNEAVNVSSASKTGAIINNLTDTAINVATIVAKANGLGPTTAATELSDSRVETIAPFKPFKVSFDPFKPAEVRKAIATVRDANFRLAVETTQGPDLSAAPEEAMVTGELDRSGVFYHPLTTVRIHLHGIDAKAAIDLHQNVPVPDLSAIAVYNLRRGVLITKSSNLTFADGELRAVTHSKPSEVLAASQIPLDVSTKLVNALPSVGDLFFPRQLGAASKTNAETARLKAEQDLAAQQLATLQAKQALEDARKGKAPSAGSSEARAATAAINTSMAAVKESATATATATQKAEQTAKANQDAQFKADLERQQHEDLEKRVKSLEDKSSK